VFIRGAGSRLLWFGVFVLSSKNRVIFFPDLQAEVERVRVARGSDLRVDRGFVVEHVTLGSRGGRCRLSCRSGGTVASR
jgi:hypothetical protein